MSSCREFECGELFQLLLRDPEKQSMSYDPGVGTMAAPEAISAVMKKVTWVLGLAFGFGLQRNVSEAYANLVEYYRPGDQVSATESAEALFA